MFEVGDELYVSQEEEAQISFKKLSAREKKRHVLRMWKRTFLVALAVSVLGMQLVGLSAKVQIFGN